jgi:AraC-like DNA-binding protein
MVERSLLRMPLFGVNVDQLEPGDLRVERATIRFPKFTLRRTRTNLGIRATGEVAANTTLVVLVADVEAPVRWSGNELSRDGLVSSHSCVEVLTRGRATFYTMTVDRDVLSQEFVRFEPAADRLRRYLDRVLSISDHYGSAATPESAGRRILAHLSLLSQDETNSGNRLRRRVAAVRQCERYVLEHIGDKLTLFDLSTASGLSVRGLVNAFHTVTGYSPMAYLKLQRLNGARRDLIAADRGIRISDIATKWGFWHFGHFTADYRAIFAETPSETLKRSLLSELAIA